jgi:RNA polymerase sigma-70 factor (ECF subfamily)
VTPAPRGGARRDEGAGPADARVLTAAIARGDAAAFGEFYDLWFDRLVALARRLTRRDEAFCLDVAQDVMLRAARTMRALPDGSAVEHWLLRAASQVAVDHVRAERRRSRREQAAARVESAREEDALERRELSEAVVAALDALPEADRTLLRARFFEDRTLDGAGAVLGLTGDAAHGRIRRILSRWRDAARSWFDA